MDKIALCLAFKVPTNYGALLQAFATQYMIDHLGYKTEIIDYYPGWDKGFIFSPEGFVALSIQKVQKTLKTKPILLDNLHEDNLVQRKKAADEFRRIRLHDIVKIKGYKELVNYSKQFKAVVVGSDQQWPPNVCFTYFRTLRFVPKGVKRVSYATSMGVSKYPWYTRRQARKFLKEIDYLSVREEQARSIIIDICDINATVTLDPSFLLSKSEWESVIEREDVISKGYILSYFLGDNSKLKSIAYDYAKSKGFKLVSLLSCEVNTDDTKYSDEILIGKSPEDFVNLIRNAECIFTDSFHGLAFSVINEKDVYVGYRNRKGVISRNSRIDNILNELGLMERLLNDTNDYKICQSSIDYDKVNKLLTILRDKSLLFLQIALK